MNCSYCRKIRYGSDQLEILRNKCRIPMELERKWSRPHLLMPECWFDSSGIPESAAKSFSGIASNLLHLFLWNHSHVHTQTMRFGHYFLVRQVNNYLIACGFLLTTSARHLAHGTLTPRHSSCISLAACKLLSAMRKEEGRAIPSGEKSNT